MIKLLDLNSIDDKKLEELELKCGIEIHQQLNTGKLFCSCPCEIVPNETLEKQISRKLRFSLSESGQVDKAAENEFKKGKYNIYKYNNHVACLVDLDEEPPKGPNKRALSVATRISQMMNLTLFDKIQFMRKLIIDGSITSGYQRTAMLGINGDLETSFGKVNINGINLEEDSCRTISRHNSHTTFALDRQGIPLIEVTTGPQIKTPQGALETAQKIGTILRSFPETKRGLGTIRQDLNVSIAKGERVEIKGTQNLKLIPEIIKAEMKRQAIHLSIIEELKSRKINKNNFSDKKIIDVTPCFDNCNSKVIQSNLTTKTCKVLAIKLNKFKGILGHELNENYRFASEISNKNKQHFPSIKGLFHSDELPKYGIEEIQVNKVNKLLNVEKQDAFILIATEEKVAKESLNYIFKIIEELLSGIVEEVRMVDPKGTVTKPLRPMPGSARMYPETDIFDIDLTNKYLKDQKENIPELFSVKLERLSKEFNINQEKIETILSKFSEEEYKTLIKNDIKSSQIFSIIFDTPKEIKKREKLDSIELEFDLYNNIIKAISTNKLSKNLVFDLFVNLYKENKTNVENLDNYLEEKNLLTKKVDEKEVEEKIKQIIKKNNKAPFGALMGICMKEFQGKVDGKLISSTLKNLL